MTEPHSRVVQDEFRRAAAGFAERTRGRFDDLEADLFARPAEGETVVEVGAGTGNFLSLFSSTGGRLIAIDLTPEMLAVARDHRPGMELVVADGGALPLASRSVDLVACAQALHHVLRPIPLIKEMRRVAAPGGRVLIVDQVAPERHEEAIAMNELEILRDPSHALSRPPSAYRTILAVAGLEVLDEKIVAVENRLSRWMWPGEFPPERIEAVRAFIGQRGAQTGMAFEAHGDDYVFTRRRIMLLARRSRDH